MKLKAFTDDNGADTIIAQDEEDAWAVWHDVYGEKREDYPDKTWEELDPAAAKTIWCDDKETPDEVGPPSKRVTKTIAEWIKQEGRGLLCTTEV